MSQATLSAGPYRNANLFAGYYLDERVGELDAWDCDEEARAAFEQIKRLWADERDLIETYNEDQLLDHWIDRVTDVLGHGRTNEVSLPESGGFVDRLLFSSEEARRDAAVLQSDGRLRGTFAKASAVVEAKRWDHAFDAQFGEARQYRDASHQVKHYLERTPDDLAWGVLTNGRKWRLYGTKEYETQTYYEVDLPELIERDDLEAFKFFYVFFRSEAFRGAPGGSFLDTVWSESETAAEELGEDLQDNVFTALRILGKGFVETNDLDLDPGDEAALAELKEQSLVLLYRLMFVLYAESRELIRPEDAGAKAEYETTFGLNEERRDVIDRVGDTLDFDDEFSRYSMTIWQRLRDLFALVDQGNDDLGVPAYNGGLFDPDDHAFLRDNAVSNRHVAEVLFRLSTVETDEGFAAADYADLDTRHLGTIYEGLLEHEFRVADEEMAAVAEDGGQVWKPATAVSAADAVETVEAGELYVVNDDGERKATGAYYTPDYVVSYIVEETVDPLVAEIEATLDDRGLVPGTEAYAVAFYNAVVDLRVLDPAMGSGHFLTRATGYLTDQVMERVRDLETGHLFSEQDVKRTVAKECIYGVDVNGMAVELAKLSMWLETLAADKPLAFLDHHLKAGNSLVGSDVTEVLSADDDASGQMTLFEVAARARKRTLEHVMDLMADLLAVDNDDLADIKSMESIYAEIRADPLYERLFDLANVHTAERFGCSVPDGSYEQMAGAIEDAEAWAEVAETDWFRAAQATAREESFFHWELEFPEVFFGMDGETREDGGFDAVVGNPPYVKIQNLRGSNPKLAEYAVDTYQTSTGRFDLYALFVEKGSKIASEGRLGYILPNKFFESRAGEGLRTYLSNEAEVKTIVDFGQHQVFNGATTYTCLLFLGSSESVHYGRVRDDRLGESAIRGVEFSQIPHGEMNPDGWILTGPRERQALSRMRDRGTPVGEMTEFISEGIVSGDNEIMFVNVQNWGGENPTKSRVQRTGAYIN